MIYFMPELSTCEVDCEMSYEIYVVNISNGSNYIGLKIKAGRLAPTLNHLKSFNKIKDQQNNAKPKINSALRR